jgi:hypothetical protein
MDSADGPASHLTVFDKVQFGRSILSIEGEACAQKGVIRLQAWSVRAAHSNGLQPLFPSGLISPIQRSSNRAAPPPPSYKAVTD